MLSSIFYFGQEVFTIKQERHRVNFHIRVPEVRLVDQDGNQVGVVKTEEARKMAEAAELDLVEVAPNAKPPVCRIMDYKRMVYEQKRRAREARKKQKTVDVKEVKLRVNIDEHDYQTKLRHAREFIEHGDKIKITIIFRGRLINHPELGQKLMKRIIEDLQDVAAVEGALPRHGRIMSFYVGKTKDA
jgi:translation initiation factor IF-3